MAIPSLIAVLVLVSMATQPSISALLSYEAQDTVLELMSEKGFTGLATANLLAKDGPRPIYRKDLGLNHVAYYEILSGDGKEYFLLSAGSKSGDNRFVESGEINAEAQQYRPTDALNKQAAKNRQTCYKHYRLSQAGLYMCEDRRGIPVAATYNWTSDAPVSAIDRFKMVAVSCINVLPEKTNKQKKKHQNVINLKQKIVTCPVVSVKERLKSNQPGKSKF